MAENWSDEMEALRVRCHEGRASHDDTVAFWAEYDRLTAEAYDTWKADEDRQEARP